MKMRFAFLSVMLISGMVRAQQEPLRPIPPTETREADVMFSKRIWRIIDLREKQNKIICWPKDPITRMLYLGVQSNQLKPYKDDSLRSVFNLEEFAMRGSSKILVRKLVDPNDPEGFYVTDTVMEPFNPEEQIDHLLLMEDWYFDKRMSKEFPRIIAIAPLFNWKVEGYDLGLQPLCWLKFDDRAKKETTCRTILVNHRLFNPVNSRSMFTYDDWFQQRRFSSFIIKTSNMYDINIMDDPDIKHSGLKALIEAERLKRETFERDANLFEE
ncbi:MAG: gliding motility protein GldN [Bacteroidia bacterium]|jgi:gliding motility associated protien GldN